MRYDTPWNQRPHAPPKGTVLGALDGIQEGEGKEFAFGEGKRAFRMLVVRRDREIWGYMNICPHFQLPVNHVSDDFMTADKSMILCKNHTAIFRVEDGFCVDGPCRGDSLIPVPVEVVRDEIVIG
jgi:nitrite reductase/ring-hydroxylating ferredoxin subunit